jgi:polysaccharide pyruvyl transferase CsaB
VTARRPHRIGISGSYGGGNIGDEAILRSIVAQLRSAIAAEIHVFSRDAGDTLRRHDVQRAVSARRISRREAQREVELLDLLVLGGGGILYDLDAAFYLRELLLAHEAGVPVMVYAIGAGPLVEPPVRALVRQALDAAADVLTVRDGPSRRLLEEIGVEREVRVTADPAWLLRPLEQTGDELLRAEAVDPGERLIGFSVREPGPAAPDLHVEHYYPLVANVADYMVARLDATVVFFPLERSHDIAHSHAVVARMRHADRATVLKREYSAEQVVSMLSRFEFAMGMRLHFLMFAALAGVPFMALPYASKVHGLLDALQLDYPPVAQTSAGELIAAFDRAWHARHALAAHVRGALPRLQQSARENHELLLRLLHATGPQPQPHAGT